VTDPVSLGWSEDGYLVVYELGRATQFAELEPGLFSERYNPDNRLVIASRAGEATVIKPDGPLALIKTPWYGSPDLHVLALVVAIGLFIAALVVWPIQASRALARRQKPRWLPLLAKLAAAAFGVLLLVLLLNIATVFSDVDPAYGLPRIVFGDIGGLTALIQLPRILAGLAALMAVFSLAAWIRPFWGAGGRIAYSLLAIVALALTWMLVYWNFL
jgi:hypothetical protein